MKNKIVILLIMIITVFSLTACNEKKEEKNNEREATEESLAFKKDYEELNGQKGRNDVAYRDVKISENNVFVEVAPEEVLNMISSGETFYVYFGSRLCPWCRSVIEKADEISKANGIEKIYYVDIWGEEGNEIFRDKYEIIDGVPKRIIEGTQAYYEFLKLFDEYLRDYELTSNAGDPVSTGEKRIYAPNYIYIEKGQIKKLVTGKSSLQKDSREELTEEMLKEEEEIFDKFFVNACDDAC